MFEKNMINLKTDSSLGDLDGKYSILLGLNRWHLRKHYIKNSYTCLIIYINFIYYKFHLNWYFICSLRKKPIEVNTVFNFLINGSWIILSLEEKKRREKMILDFTWCQQFSLKIYSCVYIYWWKLIPCFIKSVSLNIFR